MKQIITSTDQVLFLHEVDHHVKSDEVLLLHKVDHHLNSDRALLLHEVDHHTVGPLRKGGKLAFGDQTTKWAKLNS